MLKEAIEKIALEPAQAMFDKASNRKDSKSKPIATMVSIERIQPITFKYRPFWQVLVSRRSLINCKELTELALVIINDGRGEIGKIITGSEDVIQYLMDHIEERYISTGGERRERRSGRK